MVRVGLVPAGVLAGTLGGVLGGVLVCLALVGVLAGVWWLGTCLPRGLLGASRCWYGRGPLR